jgi:arylsulfatase A-like enzyme
MPLLVRYPKEIKKGAANEDLVLNLDFAPTFLDYAGVKIPQSMQGRSLRPILAGKTPKNWRQAIYYHYYEYPGWHSVKRHYGIRTQRYKLIHFYYDIDAWEFYDLQTDQYELNNRYDDPAYQENFRQLKTQLRKLRDEYGDSEALTKSFLPKKL